MKVRSRVSRTVILKKCANNLFWCALMMPLSAFAVTGTDQDQLSNVLRGVTDFITGKVGSALCTLAIIGVGFLWLKAGRIEKEQAIATAVGIGVIYSASYIVSSTMGIG